MTGSGFGVFAAYGAFMGLFAIFTIVLYVLFAFGLFTLANRRNIENAWLAWIPLAQFYTMGEVIGPVKIGDFDVSKPGLYLLIGMVGCLVLAQIPGIGFIFSLAMAVLSIGAAYYLFKRYTTDNNPMLFTILSAVTCGFLVPIFVFMIRNNEDLNKDSSLTV
ncbi:MAG TPA: hypothetical protein PKN87_04295 [Syntrophomonadaceae bacterium]|nr:hypothetical protein [Syntrophomonadaceae bacterium]HNX28616.1 hypothetical protein [Syntrophomonadaceae bacterium]HPR94014.1 hypothetical protein [Syntrophomonadaceae bacterium]